MKNLELILPFVMCLGLMLIITGFSINEAITAIIGMSLVIIVLLIWMGKGIMYILKKIKKS